MTEASMIRLATAADRLGVERCVHLAYNPYIDDVGKVPAPMLDDYGDLIERGVVRVADASGEVVGLIVMWAEPDHFYIDNIAVDPAHRSLGLGAGLLDAAEAAARAADRSEIRLYTNEAMTSNIGYYQRRGFVETHRAVSDGYRRVYFARSINGAT